MSKHMAVDIRVPIEVNNPAIYRVESQCIKCGQCRDVCNQQISVGHHYELAETGDNAICIHCGQCANVCPTNAIREVQDFMKVERVLLEGKKRVVAITSPSVRVGLGEEFGMQAGSYVEEQMVGSLRALGIPYIFDTTFAADLTIMEEASELIDRITTGKVLPQFTSCCPAWVKFVETYYPHLLPNISTSKSPISMFAPTIKTYFAKKEGIAPEDIYVVALTPCTAKKFEINRKEMSDASKYHNAEEYADCDAVITTRELANWLRAHNLSLDSVTPSEYDTLMPRGSGAGIIFGNTGGVMEAAIRTAYNFLTGEQPTADLLKLEAVRGLDGVRSAALTINNIPLKVAIVHGTDNARRFLSHLETTKEHYDFVEVMTCPGGCIGGGGQPKHIGEDMQAIRKRRIDSLYEKDQIISLRNSHDNPHIKQLYDEFFKNPLSVLSEELLHTTYHVRDDLKVDPSLYKDIFTQEKSISTSSTCTSDIHYRCSVCGYIYDGDLTLEGEDYQCPLCSVPKALFEKVEEETKDSTISIPDVIGYKCSICGYIYEGDIMDESDDYRCPICSVSKDLFEKMEE